MDLSCGFKGVPLLDRVPCGGLRSSMDQVIGSIRFWQDLVDSLSYHVLLRVISLCFNSCNTLIAQSRLVRIGSISLRDDVPLL